MVLQHDSGTDKFSFSGICFHDVMFHDAKETLPQHLCWNVTIIHQLGKRSAQEINLCITLSSILLKPITLDNAIYQVHDSMRFS